MVGEVLDAHGVVMDLDPSSPVWVMERAPESRPGRGHDVVAVASDGEHMVHVVMDVYGHGSVAVAALTWVHSPDPDDPCDCTPDDDTP